MTSRKVHAFLRGCKHWAEGQEDISAKAEAQWDSDVNLVIFRNGDLIRKMLKALQFPKEVKIWTTVYIEHKHIRNVWRNTIQTKKHLVQRHHVVLHFDFAEN